MAGPHIPLISPVKSASALYRDRLVIHVLLIAHLNFEKVLPGGLRDTQHRDDPGRLQLEDVLDVDTLSTSAELPGAEQTDSKGRRRDSRGTEGRPRTEEGSQLFSGPRGQVVAYCILAHGFLRGSALPRTRLRVQ